MASKDRIKNPKVIAGIILAACFGFMLIATIAAKPSEAEVAYLSAAGGTASDDEQLAKGYNICEAPLNFARTDGERAVSTLCPEKADKFHQDWADIDRVAAKKAADEKKAREAAEQKQAVDQVCQQVAGWNPTEVFLPEKVYVNDYKRTVALENVRVMVANNCPEYKSIIDQKDAAIAAEAAATAETERKLAEGTAISGGSYVVGTGAGQMRPGTWATTSTNILENCYWERTGGADGGIIDNYISSAASKVTVTVRSGETFTSERCGSWEKVA